MPTWWMANDHPLANAGSFDDYCVRQHRHLGIDVRVPGEVCVDRVRQNNNGTLPGFPLPLGDERCPAQPADQAPS